jgi:hypothetical protein
MSDPAQIIRRKILSMLAQKINPESLHPLEAPEIERHYESRPDVAELELVALKSELDLLDRCSRVGERADGFVNDLADRRIDGKDAEIGAVADLPALYRAARRARKSSLVSMENGSRAS